MKYLKKFFNRESDYDRKKISSQKKSEDNFEIIQNIADLLQDTFDVNGIVYDDKFLDDRPTWRINNFAGGNSIFISIPNDIDFDRYMFYSSLRLDIERISKRLGVEIFSKELKTPLGTLYIFRINLSF